MALDSGTRLGSFEVVTLLGAGGMGEVYRARDTKLGRDVALKIVLEAFLADRERLERLEREARALAALNHPNVATLHGFEEAGGRRFLVMELVEGATLAERLAAGPLPVDEAIAIGRQIAEALEAAHEKGIVHRDLKPANIKITPDGKVKVLDFGLARATDPPGSPSMSLANSPTVSAMATQAGVILGTASYMSPEQARGFPADHRSDVFSFGIVLYETLAGRQPFQGETVSDVLASVIAREPDLDALPADLVPRLADLIRRCLEKQPRRRWQAIGDVRHELETIAASPRAAVPPPPVAPAPGPWWRRAAPVAAALFGGAALGAAAIGLTRPVPAAPPVVRFDVPLGEGLSRTGVQRTGVAISPDGGTIAFTADRQIYVRRLDTMDVQPVAGTLRAGRAAIDPVFSPDGQAIAYVTQGDDQLQWVDAAGGSPVTVTTLAHAPLGLTWQGGHLVYALNDGIYRAPVRDGAPEILLALPGSDMVARPQILPDGRSILFTVGAAVRSGSSVTADWSSSRIVVQRLGEPSRTTIVDGGLDARFLPSGHLVYLNSGVLYARRFDPETLATGPAVPVVDGIGRAYGTVGSGLGSFSISGNGTLVYLPGPSGDVTAGVYQVGVFEADGSSTLLDVPPGPYATPRLSPDGRWLALGHDDGRDVSIQVYDRVSGGAVRRLTFGGRDRFPAWTADGTHVIFQSDRGGDVGLYRQRADGSAGAERLTTPGTGVTHVPLSAHGSTLLVDETAASRTTLMTLSLSDGTLASFGGVTSTTPTGAVFSPDGRWVAYSTREPGRGNRTFVQPFPPTGAVFQVSGNDEDGHHQVWSPDGARLIYNPGPAADLAVVGIQAGSGFAVRQGMPFSRAFLSGPPQIERTFDVDREGFRVVGLLAPGAAGGVGDRFRVVVNWTTELDARVPAR